MNGKVKWFNGAKGYGFIERGDKEKDVHRFMCLHCTECR